MSISSLASRFSALSFPLFVTALKICSFSFHCKATAELLSSQREWVNELMTWIFQNRVLYTGPNSLDQFCSALLLHLQSFSPSTSLLPSVASHVHQVW